jgi:hypothetical protein
MSSLNIIFTCKYTHGVSAVPPDSPCIYILMTYTTPIDRNFTDGNFNLYFCKTYYFERITKQVPPQTNLISELKFLLIFGKLNDLSTNSSYIVSTFYKSVNLM